MIYDNLDNIHNKKFFAIIVGSGPAGISTALKLEKKGYDTLILEAGSTYYQSENKQYLDGDVIGDSYNDLKMSRLRQFGGSSANWGGTCTTYKDSDFNDWPIKKKNLEIYEKETNEILNLRKNFYHSKFSENLDFFNTQWSNVRFKEKYFRHIKNSKNIFLSLDTTFCYLNGKNGEVKNITCLKKNKKYIINSIYVILSCGGIENSRFLLINKKKNPSLFKSSLPIGKYYMDHPKHDVGKGLIVNKKLKQFLQKKQINNFPLIECENINLSLNKNHQNNDAILNSGLTIKLKRATPYTDIVRQASCVAPRFIQNIYSSLKEKDVYEFNLSIIQEQAPYSENKVVLSSNLDPSNLELVKIHWKISPLLRISAYKIINEFSNILLNEDLGRLSINDNILEKKNLNLTLGYHQMGGTRMGTYSHDSVVDKNLLVHGFKNLYINGSSVFRTAGFAWPTFTIVQLATRLGEHLTEL